MQMKTGDCMQFETISSDKVYEGVVMESTSIKTADFEGIEIDFQIEDYGAAKVLFPSETVTKESINYNTLYGLYGDIIGIFNTFGLFVFPFMFILAIFLIISNIALIKHEGKSFVNTLGIIMGLLLIFVPIIGVFAIYFLMMPSGIMLLINSLEAAMLPASRLDEGRRSAPVPSSRWLIRQPSMQISRCMCIRI